MSEHRRSLAVPATDVQSNESRRPVAVSSPAAARPTNVRYGVLGFSVSMAVILYLDRMAIAVPAQEIARDLDLSLAQVGDSMAAFFWSYALCQVPAGWLGDRWGGRRALTLYVIAWSLAMVGLGLAGGLLSLLLMRGLMGVTQAGAYATTASFLRRWMPLERRGIANSSVSLGGRAGGVLAPALTPVLMVAVVSAMPGVQAWRPVFIGYALVGLVWAALFWRWFRDQPQEHAACNDAERALLERDAVPGEGAGSGLAAGSLPLRAMLTNRGLLLLSLVCFSINIGWIFLVTWLPTYLIEVHGATRTQAGLCTSLTALAGMAGCLAGGAATDLLVPRVGLRWGRTLPGIFAHGGAALALVGCWFARDAVTVIGLLIVGSFMCDFGLGSVWASFQDIGRRYAGTVLGFANMCGNIGAAVAISAIGRIAHAEGYGWPATFAMAAGAFGIAAVAWLGVDPRVTIETAAQTLPLRDATAAGR
ncbi:MAG: MFS transporter [Pirellulales bacterium]